MRDPIFPEITCDSNWQFIKKTWWHIAPDRQVSIDDHINFMVLCCQNGHHEISTYLHLTGSIRSLITQSLAAKEMITVIDDMIKLALKRWANFDLRLVTNFEICEIHYDYSAKLPINVKYYFLNANEWTGAISLREQDLQISRKANFQNIKSKLEAEKYRGKIDRNDDSDEGVIRAIENGTGYIYGYD